MTLLVSHAGMVSDVSPVPMNVAFILVTLLVSQFGQVYRCQRRTTVEHPFKISGLAGFDPFKATGHELFQGCVFKEKCVRCTALEMEGAGYLHRLQCSHLLKCASAHGVGVRVVEGDVAIDNESLYDTVVVAPSRHRTAPVGADSAVQSQGAHPVGIGSDLPR